VPLYDDDRDGEFGSEMTNALHFGGGDDNEGAGGGFTLKRGDHGVDGAGGEGGGKERRKTKKEVMEELIQKSKYHKAQKTKQREADEDMLDKLDDDFKTISGAGLFRQVLSKVGLLSIPNPVNHALSHLVQPVQVGIQL
jgi:nucleolar protein 14